MSCYRKIRRCNRSQVTNKRTDLKMAWKTVSRVWCSLFKYIQSRFEPVDAYSPAAHWRMSGWARFPRRYPCPRGRRAGWCGSWPRRRPRSRSPCTSSPRSSGRTCNLAQAETSSRISSWDSGSCLHKGRKCRPEAIKNYLEFEDKVPEEPQVMLSLACTFGDRQNLIQLKLLPASCYPCCGEELIA